ncbi:MAG TPA: Mpo1-like protein [Balneolales bacterium]|nr:Mpo1-like protein [Balneolales bacterium]
MKKVDRLLQDYASSHRTKGNIITHFIGIPLIVLGLISMLVRLPLLSESFTVAEALIILVTIFYFALDVKLGTVMLIAVLLLDVVARGIGSFWIGFLIFATGWLFQGIGHAVYEKHSPAF